MKKGAVCRRGTMIDWHRVEELRDEIGPEDFGEVVSLFLEEADEVVSRLQATKDAKTMERDLHFLKGSALNLGFSDLAQVCQLGERRAASGFADIQMDQVETCYARSRSTFLSQIAISAA
jgi:histidine phosphotransfer protein HptB